MKKTLCLYWDAFNDWRKRYWVIRVILLLLIFSSPIYERVICGKWLIVQLVEYACDGVFIQSTPSTETAVYRYYKFQEKKRIQRLIFLYADSNHNKILDPNEIKFLTQKGVNLELLSKNPLHLDIYKIAKIAKRLDLLPKSYSPKEECKKAFYAALAEVENFNKPLKREVYSLLEASNSFNPHFTEKQLTAIQDNFPDKNIRDGSLIVDYRTWNTWKFGALMFYEYFFSPFFPLLPFITWFLIASSLSVLAFLYCGKYGKFAAISASIIYSFTLFNINFFRNVYKIRFLDITTSFQYITISLSIISCAIIAGLIGIKIASKIKRTPFITGVLFFLIASLLLFRNFYHENLLFYWCDGLGFYLMQKNLCKVEYINENIAIALWLIIAAIIFFLRSIKKSKLNKENL